MPHCQSRRTTLAWAGCEAGHHSLLLSAMVVLAGAGMAYASAPPPVYDDPHRDFHRPAFAGSGELVEPPDSASLMYAHYLSMYPRSGTAARNGMRAALDILVTPTNYPALRADWQRTLTWMNRLIQVTLTSDDPTTDSAKLARGFVRQLAAT